MITELTVLLAILSAIMIIGNGVSRAEDIEKNCIKAIVTIVFLAGLTATVGSLYKDIGYKEGQIDAITNNIEYRLIIMPDSTKVWEKIVEVVK
jgi:hypothetical protein